MGEQENVEQLMRKLHEIMKKQGCQAQSFKVGNQVIKISLQSQNHILTDSETSLDRTVRENSDTKPAKKKISLSSAVSDEQAQAPNACFRNFFQQGDEQCNSQPASKPQQSAWIGEVNEHINFLLSNHPESKDHIQAVLCKLELVESENKERRKVEEEISNMLSSSLSTSRNIFESESTLLSLSRLSDPLCRLVSTHLKNLASGSLKSSDETPTFLFLYSQPLVSTGRDGSLLPLYSQIDYEREQENIRKILKDCKVGYTKECATVERVGNWLQSGIEVIHFCGHGVKGDKTGEGDFLIFEDKDARAEFVDQDSLCQILKRLKRPLQFMFVASCHSGILGEVFLRAGVPHVICVRREERILDEACQEFVRLFYLSCLNNGMTICESFEFAKLQVSLMGFPKGQQHKFVLLTKPTSGLSQHCCSTLNNPRNGQFKDLTLKPLYSRNIPSKVQNFIVRHQIMAEVISALAKHRFITIKGIPGIGKSTLIRELVRYLNFRGKFKDGILYTQLAGCQTVDGLFQSLTYEIFDACSDKRSFDDCLDSIARELHGKHVLLVIDNCDSLLGSNDRVRFKQIIESLLRRCHQVYLIFSNRTRVGDLLHSCELEYCTERVFHLDKLGPEDAENLFKSKAPRPILIEEQQQFLKMQRVTELKSHPLFQFLNGHPQAISLSAALLGQKSLKQVYQMLMQQSLADQFAVKHDNNRGYNAFRVSLEVSWNIINNRQPNAALMFRVMGMIPAGLDNDLMPRVFGARWRQAVKVLNKYSLLKKTDRLGATYYSIHPFTISYAESLLENEEKRRFHEKITEELQRRLFERVYKNVGTLSSSAQKAAELYLVEEINYKACIYREYYFLGDDTKIKSFYKNLFSRPEDGSEDEGTEYKKQSDTNSQRSSTSSTSKFMNEHKKIRDQSSDDDAKPLDEKGRRLASKEKSPRGEQEAGFKAKKKDPPAILRLMLYQATVLFIVKNFPACQRIVKWGLELSMKLKSPLSQANFYRILACLSLMKKEESRARDLFSKALQIFALVGCGLGTASCQSAIGYIRYLEEEYAPAKKSLESALKYYEQLPHLFGKHYLNRWLYSIKSKINRQKKQLVTHNEQAKKLIKQAKAALKGNKIDNFLLKHKVGCFIFRFMFDNISLFLECSFQIDVKPKKIPLSTTKDQSILKNLATQVGPNKRPVLDAELFPVEQDEQKSVQEIIDDLDKHSFDDEAEWQEGDLAEFYKDEDNNDFKDIDFNEEEFEIMERNLLKNPGKAKYTQESLMELARVDKLKGHKNSTLKPQSMMKEVAKPSPPIHGKSRQSVIALEKKKQPQKTMEKLPEKPEKSDRTDPKLPRQRTNSINSLSSLVQTPKPPKK